MVKYLRVLVIFLLLCGLQIEAKNYEPTLDLPVNNIYREVPDDLSQETLLVGKFDQVGMPNKKLSGREKREYEKRVKFINDMAKDSNKELASILKRRYPYDSELVSLNEIEELKAKGYKYFLDVVWMPKQMNTPRREAMVTAYKKFKTANKMYSNRDTQFHFYFYIRNIETDDVYLTTDFKGHVEAYKGMDKFLKQVKEDAGK